MQGLTAEGAAPMLPMGATTMTTTSQTWPSSAVLAATTSKDLALASLQGQTVEVDAPMTPPMAATTSQVVPSSTLQASEAPMAATMSEALASLSGQAAAAEVPPSGLWAVVPLSEAPSAKAKSMSLAGPRESKAIEVHCPAPATAVQGRDAAEAAAMAAAADERKRRAKVCMQQREARELQEQQQRYQQQQRMLDDNLPPWRRMRATPTQGQAIEVLE